MRSLLPFACFLAWIQSLWGRRESDFDFPSLSHDRSSSEERFEALCMASSDWVWEVNADIRYTFVSSRVTEILGYEVDELLGRTPFDFMSADEIERVTKEFGAIAENRESFRDFENTMRHKDGSYRVLLTSGTPILDAKSDLIGYRGMDRDVTEKQRSKRLLRLSQFALENIIDAIYWVKPNGSIYYANQAASNMVGFSPEILTRMSIMDIDPEVDESGWHSHWMMLKRDRVISLETVHRTNDGRIFPIEVNAHYIQFEGDEYDIAIVRDISERKAAELAIQTINSQLEQRIDQRTAELVVKSHLLADSEERFRLAMQASSDGVWDRNVQTGDAYYSPGYFTMLGYESGEFPRHHDTWKSLLHPDDKDAVLAESDRMMTSGCFEMEFRMRKKSGDYCWILSRGGIVEWDELGNPLRAIGTHRDITQRKLHEQAISDLNATLEAKVEQRTAQLAQANAVKGQFLAHMSHEIRTPLNAILGFTQIIKQEGWSPDHAHLIDRIGDAGDVLLKTINDILDLSKIEAGRFRIDPQPFTLSSLLYRVDQLLRQTANQKGLNLLFFDIPANLGPLLGDQLRLEQVLINLLNNAIKFTSLGQVSLGVEVVSNHLAHARLRFKVQDTGIGMSKEVLSKLFQPFSQGDKSITRRFGGTGLGLSISKRLVELMEGEMGVASEKGRGSVFWFEVPFEKPQDINAGGENEKKHEEAEDFRIEGLRVLAVDDSRINLMIVERALRLEGALVTLAHDGHQAVELLKKHPADFDVLLMDVQMPVMDGLTATREIRRHPEFSDLPIVALTAGVLPEEQEAIFKAGMNDFLPKPVNLKQMKSILGKCGLNPPS